MRRVLIPLVVLVLALTTGGVVFALNYEGEDFCQDTTAWPGGSYLGQMHPFHVTHYSQYAESTNVDPCQAWASDQRHSAVRGLRELGYTVFGPGEFAWPELPPLTAVDPDSLTHRSIAGFDDGAGTMHLLRGVHTISTTFDGWHQGPVRIEVVGPDGVPVVVHDGLIHYVGTVSVPAPQAGSYQFTVQAAGGWQLETGQAPQIVRVPVEVEVEVEVPAELTIGACEDFLGANQGG